ncbi:Fic family protein [Lentzea alba]|uniref:Fic family protein n=1 Tax=Lentzea alba TaxID=2714351 RepID=UPI0039BF4ECA
MYRPIPDFAAWPAPQNPSELTAKYNQFAEMLSRTDPEVADTVIQKLGREAAAETGAIEGLYSLSVGQTRVIAAQEPGWEEVLTAQRSDALSLFGAQVDTYEFVRAQASIDEDFTEYWLRGLHARVCSGQSEYEVHVGVGDGTYLIQKRELRHGHYKTEENETERRDGGVLKFCPVFDLIPEMHRLAGQVNSIDFMNASAITQAAYAHYCLTHIHPFPDGNGRTARAWASYYTYQSFDLPIIVYSDRKMSYLQALEYANVGSYGELVEHFAYRVTNTIERAIEELEFFTRPSAVVMLEDLLAIKPADARVRLADARDMATSIMDVVDAEFKQRITLLASLGKGEIDIVLNAAVMSGGKPHLGSVPMGEQFNAAGSRNVKSSLKEPSSVSSRLDITIGIAQDLEADYTFFLWATRPASGYPGSLTVSRLRLAYEDAFPDVGTSAIERIALFAERALIDLLDDLQRQKRAIYRRGGVGTA